MTPFQTFSKQQIARIFGVNRSTVYSWAANNFPVRPPERPGRPSQINFEEALDWFLNHEEIKGVSDEGLEIFERTIRARKDKFYGGKS